MHPGEHLVATMTHRGERSIKWIAFGLALAVHVVVLMLNFPAIRMAKVTPHDTRAPIVVRKYVPPPPRVRRPGVTRVKYVRKMPVPDPTPDAPEPIREALVQYVDGPQIVMPEIEVMVGNISPPAPKATGPVFAGVAGVTNPMRIEESYVLPLYPELARQTRIEADVVLRAVIRKNGSVGEIEVLLCNRPSLGFEESAVKAVRQWRYEPARMNGEPVDAYFTVFVEFRQV